MYVGLCIGVWCDEPSFPPWSTLGTDLCTALMALLHAMGHKASSHQLEMLFTTFQLQWGSLVGECPVNQRLVSP